MLTIGSLVSPVLSRRLSIITTPRLLTAFTKNVLNTSARSLLRETVSSFWVSVILLRLLELLFARKCFTVFQNFLLSLMFLVSRFSLDFSFRKRLTQ